MNLMDGMNLFGLVLLVGVLLILIAEWIGGRHVR